VARDTKAKISGTATRVIHSKFVLGMFTGMPLHLKEFMRRLYISEKISTKNASPSMTA
tara:strand:+ start:174 stop:347 length:174 start_codon:yes stop_codon:yes gene_type:complete